MADYKKILAENIKQTRKALKMSQEQLALKSDVHRTYVSGIERAKRNPSLTLIVKLATKLKTTPAALLTPPATTSKAPGTCTASSRSMQIAEELGPRTGRVTALLDSGRAAAPRRGDARAARPRRQGARRLERPDDPRPRNLGRLLGEAAQVDAAAASRRFPAPELLARGPAARGLERRRRTFPRLSG